MEREFAPMGKQNCPQTIPAKKTGVPVLIFTAAVGGGHLAAANALGAAFREEGYEVKIIEGLSEMSRVLRWIQADFYAWQLEHAPWLYDLCFKVLALPSVVKTIRFLIGTLWGDRLLAMIEAAKPDVIVSTFPTITAGLGQLKRAGRLGHPVVAVVTDYGVHPMWVSPEIELHLVLDETPKRLAERAGGYAQIMTFPVDPRFRAGMPRVSARNALGLPQQASIALIVGGAWGVGRLEETTERVLAAGAFPVVVTGQNARLRQRLERKYAGVDTIRIIGWTDEMPLLMAAADCLIQNAGGVTCLEAFAAGLPVVFFRPIPGHGVLNATLMEQAGVAQWARTHEAMTRILHEAASGIRALPAPRARSGCEVVPAILNTTPRRPPVALPARSWRRAVGTRPVAALVALLLCLIVTFSTPGNLLAARMLRHPVVDEVAQPGTRVVIVTADDAATASALEQWIAQQPEPVALFVSPSVAEHLPTVSGVTVGLVAPTSRRDHLEFWTMRHQLHQAAATIERRTGQTPVFVLVSGQRLGVAPLIAAPEHAVLVLNTPQRQDESPAIAIVDTSGLTPQAAVAQAAHQVHLICALPSTCLSLRSVPIHADGDDEEHS